MSVTCCPAPECGAAMELRGDFYGEFFHCRECGMDWDVDDLEPGGSES